MRRKLLIAAVVAWMPTAIVLGQEQDRRYGEEFDKHFTDNTLRIDLTVNCTESKVDVEDVKIVAGWHGRRVNMSRLYIHNDMEVAMLDKQTGDTLFRTSQYHGFLYGQDEVEQPSVNVLRLPLPQCAVDIEIAWFDTYRDTILCNKVEISDQLLQRGLRRIGRQRLADKQTPMRTLLASHHPSPINIAIVAEGYTAEEMPLFDLQSQAFVDSLMGHEGFEKYRDRFQITAVRLQSQQSGVTHLSVDDIKETAIGSQFGAYDLARLLTIPDMRILTDALEGVPYDWLIALANTDEYGGSGAFHAYSIGYTGNWGMQVSIHEFGHHFIGLADEYEEGGYEDSFAYHLEPCEPNITTQVNFTGKWENLIADGAATLIEGAGYVPKGVWRGCEHCLMRKVSDYRFCPVCTQAITRCIQFLTEPLP